MQDPLHFQHLSHLRSLQKSAERSQRDLALELRELESLLEKTLLANQALYEWVKDHTGLTDEVFRERVREIDKRDGREDHEFSAEPLRCPKCGTTVTRGAFHCYGCGATIAPEYPFTK